MALYSHIKSGLSYSWITLVGLYKREKKEKSLEKVQNFYFTILVDTL